MADKAQKEIVKGLIERWKRLADNDDHNRKNAREEKLFAAGEQWPENIRKDREADDRPCITINRVQQMVKQVTNDMRQNRAGIRVHATSDGARQDVADIRAGLIRAIEAKSAASQCYIQAADDAVKAQIGYVRVVPQYEDGKSFNQELTIEWIQDSLSVYYGDYKKPDGSDAQECYILTRIPKDQFKREHPKAQEVPFPAEFDAAADWCNEEDITIGETYNIEQDEDTLYMLVDGTTALLSAMPGKPPKEAILRERKVFNKKLVVRKITAVEVLEEASYPIPYLFVVPVIGEEYVMDGKHYRLSLTRHAMDPQRVYNYSRTMTTEQVALAPRAPYIMAEGQAEGHEDEWGTANSKNHAWLAYKPQSIAGQLAPAPQRQPFTGVPAGALSDLQLASDEIKAVTGIYDASLGAKGNETSGKAILARQREADNATFHYVDNLNRAILQVGVVLNELLPLFYDTPRIVRIIGDDGVEGIAKVGGGLDGINLGDGRYDVVLDVGPSYETKRIEATNSMTAFMQAVPNAAPLMADELARNMDWPGARRIAERLKLLLPPEVKAAEGGGPQIPPELSAKMQEMGMVIQQLQQALQQQLAENEQMQADASTEQQKLALEQQKTDTEAYRAKTERLQMFYETMTNAQTNDQTALQQVADSLMREIQSLREEIVASQKEDKSEPPEAPTAPVPQIVHVMQQPTPRPPRRELRIVGPSGTTYEGVVVEDSEGGTTVSLAEVPNVGGMMASCSPQ